MRRESLGELPQILTQIEDDDRVEFDRRRCPSLILLSEDSESEIYFKIKEDSLVQGGSLGTNQSEWSGSTFSLPGYRQQQSFLSQDARWVG